MPTKFCGVFTIFREKYVQYNRPYWHVYLFSLYYYKCFLLIWVVRLLCCVGSLIVIVTLVTSILNTFMHRLNMFSKTAWICILLVTLLITRLSFYIFSLMPSFVLNMSGQATLCCSLIVTLVTSILDTFMFRLNMSRQMTLLRSLIVTVITIKFDTFM